MTPEAARFLEKAVRTKEKGSNKQENGSDPFNSGNWKEEVRKRCCEIDEGTVELRDAGDVFAEAYTALK